MDSGYKPTRAKGAEGRRRPVACGACWEARARAGVELGALATAEGEPVLACGGDLVAGDSGEGGDTVGRRSRWAADSCRCEPLAGEQEREIHDTIVWPRDPQRTRRHRRHLSEDVHVCIFLAVLTDMDEGRTKAGELGCGV
jgi:hypothetical protein